MKEKYLIKFVGKEQHADDLINGRLFMHSAAYYHNLECGQGDLREGGLSHLFMAHMNTGSPIFCMYTAYENQCQNGVIWISRKNADDFFSDESFAVIIPYNDFTNRIDNNIDTIYAYAFGPVVYKFIDVNLSKKLFLCKHNEHLFYKHPYFAYQQEFRIIISDKINETEAKTYQLKDRQTFKDVSIKMKITEANLINSKEKIGLILPKYRD